MHNIGLKIKTHNLHVINTLYIDFSCCHHIMMSAALVRDAVVGWVCVCGRNYNREMGKTQSYLFLET
jgi:hypothetical protein